MEIGGGHGADVVNVFVRTGGHCRFQRINGWRLGGIQRGVTVRHAAQIRPENHVNDMDMVHQPEGQVAFFAMYCSVYRADRL